MEKRGKNMVLGVDFGDSRTGYAISDSLELMAHTLEVFHEKNFNKVAKVIAFNLKNLVFYRV